MMNYVMGIIVSIAFLIVLGYFIVKIQDGIILWMENNNKEIKVIKVLVLGKKIDENILSSYDNSNVFCDGSTECAEDNFNEKNNNSNTYLFCCENSESKEKFIFQIKPELYKAIKVNTEGILTYQGTRFKQFMII